MTKLTEQTFHPKVCILYHYFELNQNYRDNLLHFLTFGSNVQADIICLLASTCSVALPRINNVEYISIENKNWDYGGYSYALLNIVNIQDYDYFIFINSSMRGPYRTPNSTTNWIESYLQHFDDDVGIVGCAINILPNSSQDSIRFLNTFPQFKESLSHVQTTAYVLSKKAINLLLAENFYCDQSPLTKHQVIDRYEILLSQRLIAAGLNLKCLLPEYNKIDYRKKHSNPNMTAYNGDPSVVDGYFGRTIHPYEGMFIKSERNLYPKYFLDLLAHAMCVHQNPIHQLIVIPDYNELLQHKHVAEFSISFRVLFKKLRKSFKNYIKLVNTKDK